MQIILCTTLGSHIHTHLTFPHSSSIHYTCTCRHAFARRYTYTHTHKCSFLQHSTPSQGFFPFALEENLLPTILNEDDKLYTGRTASYCGHIPKIGMAQFSISIFSTMLSSSLSSSSSSSSLLL